MRLFIGIIPDEHARVALAAVSQGLALPSPARIVPPALFHVTVVYLGERTEGMLPGLATLVTRCAASAVPFTLAAAGIGFFGTPGNAIVHVAFKPCAPLAALNDGLRAALAEAGDAFDPKALVPHVTLARKAALPSASYALADAQPLAFSLAAEGLTLFHSTHEGGAPAYVLLITAPFQHSAGGRS